MTRKLIVVALAALFAGCAMLSADTPKPRREISLDGSGWRVWMDEKAEWVNDTLYAPGEVPALGKLPLNPPTGGWEALDVQGSACSVPASVEEIFSKGVNSWTYHGVSWFRKTVNIPAEWQGKTIRLTVGKARLRVELFVNNMLAGYDLCCETPLEFDISKFLKYGEENRIAFRLTNPGCRRGWEDIQWVKWGNYSLPASHDFTGLDNVRLVATAPVFVSDIFVKNLLPAGARNVEVCVTVNNNTANAEKRTVSVSIPGACVATRQDATLPPGETVVKCSVSAPGAKLWDIEHPNLYNCDITLTDNRQLITDNSSVRFGFRVSEVVSNSAGQHHFLWNGGRIRIRSAIDWGYYGLTGFYATPEMARRSVESARAVGHNGINFHRRIGEPLVLKYADELGLYLYEEPGGFMTGGQGYNIAKSPIAVKLMLEKIRRMVIRDRNHPSLMMYCLANEDNNFPAIRDQALKLIHKLDPTRLALNSSGANGGGHQPQVRECHFRPYENEIRSDFRDTHGAFTGAANFHEGDIRSMDAYQPGCLNYWGEVRCYTGPANWFKIGNAILPDNQPGYDRNLYAPMAAKLSDFFTRNRLADTGSKIIKSPADISTQAGRSLMYVDGRLGQIAMSHDQSNGYAINGWSPGPQLPDAWDSAICDELRNVKGHASDMAYWNRGCQIAIFRSNGKFFKPGDAAKFTVSLINESHVPAGDYTLKLTATDGVGAVTDFAQTVPVKVIGGDVHAQPIGNADVVLGARWRAGFITLHGALMDTKGKIVADGAEQILLQNRASYAGELAGTAIAVVNWPAAETALKDAQIATVPVESATVVVAGAVAAATTPSPQPSPLKGEGADVRQLLDLARTGKILIVKCDAAWAKLLHEQGVLSEPVTQWGGHQSAGWNGNGWGYLDHFVGNQAVPSKTIIGTRAWETPGDPVGFWPFASRHKQTAYGAYVARNDVLLVLLGAIDYGKGKIILAPSYPVDANQAFNDLLFFNLISRSARKEW